MKHKIGGFDKNLTPTPIYRIMFNMRTLGEVWEFGCQVQVSKIFSYNTTTIVEHPTNS